MLVFFLLHEKNRDMKSPLKILFVFTILGVLSVVQAKQNLVGDFDFYVLALSWQSAFCEMNQKKVECRQQALRDYSASRFSLHGLWPNRLNDKKHTYAYCNVDRHMVQADKKRRWCDLGEVFVDSELERKMPGVKSCLHMHEWVKHGKCSGMKIEKYFDMSLNLLDAFSTTGLARIIGANIGRSVLRRDLFAAWKKEFPAVKGSLALRCRKRKGRSYLTEVRIGLKKVLRERESELSSLLKGPVGKSNCAKNIYIDAVGFD